MSCQKCDEAQERGDSYYFRIDKANILISGCQEHVKETQKRLRQATEPVKSLKERKPK